MLFFLIFLESHVIIGYLICPIYGKLCCIIIVQQRVAVQPELVNSGGSDQIHEHFSDIIYIMQ